MLHGAEAVGHTQVAEPARRATLLKVGNRLSITSASPIEEMAYRVALLAGLIVTGFTGCANEPANTACVCDEQSGTPANIIWERDFADPRNLPYLREIQAVPGGVVLLLNPGDNTGYSLVRLSDEGDETARVQVPPLNSGGGWQWEGLRLNSDDELILTATDSGSFRVIWMDPTSLNIESSRVFRVPRLGRDLVQRGDEIWSFTKEQGLAPTYVDEVLQIDVVTRTTHDTLRLPLDPSVTLDLSDVVPLDNGKVLACARIEDPNTSLSDAEWLMLELDIETSTIERLPQIAGGVTGCDYLRRVGNHVLVGGLDEMGYVRGLLNGSDGSLVVGPVCSCHQFRHTEANGTEFLTLGGGGMVAFNTRLESESYTLPRAAYSWLSVDGDRIFVGSNTIDDPVWDHDVSVTRIERPPAVGSL